MIKIYCFILQFLFIFGFRFHGSVPITSSMVCGTTLLMHLIVNRNFRDICVAELSRVSSIKIILMYILINCWACISLIVNDSYDFSFLITFLHMFCIVIIGSMLYCYYQSKNREKYIVNDMILCFVVQTFIQWTAFFSGSFKELINVTKTASAIQIGWSYGSIRANALAGSDFFGLAIAYGVIYLIFFSNKNTLVKNDILNLLMYTFLVTGTFSAGRTGYVGLAIAMLFFILYRINYSKKVSMNINKLVAFSTVIPLFLIMAYKILTYEIFSEKIENLFNYTFQMIFNYIDNGTVMISSLESLQNMYVDVPVWTLFFGDAKYTLYDGTYYMHTDVGFLRVIIYIGVIGLVFMMLMMFYVLRLTSRGEVLLKSFMILMICIFSLKGEVIMWNQIFLSILVLFSIQDARCSTN